jgi:hypothetical protein
MTVNETLAEAASIERRLRFASWSRASLQRTFHRMGLRRLAVRLGNTPYSAANLLYDLVEWPRNRFRLSHPGQVHIAALAAPTRVPQPPRHRGYWYDPQRHALVGLHLGLDLLRHQGRYHFIEANISAALRPERRALYRSGLDPFICELLALAERHDFKRIVMCRAGWSEYYLREFAVAQRKSGIEVIGASSPIVQSKAPHPMGAPPEQLQESTIYVIFSGQGTTLSLYVHDKLWAARWLQKTLDAHPSRARLLTYIPTYETLTLPSEPQDPMWPNLVVKLASRDQGKFVLMGRFRSEAQARDALGLRDPDDIPGAFDIGLGSRILDRMFPFWLQTIYQPFIPPEIVDGALRTIRLHLFVSPLTHQFHSAHHVVTSQNIPEVLPEGLIEDPSPYIRSFATRGCHYERPEGAIESELRNVALDFGRVANLAIKKRFVITPD